MRGKVPVANPFLLMPEVLGKSFFDRWPAPVWMFSFHLFNSFCLFFGYIRYFQDISRYNVAEMPNDLSGLMLICVCVSTVYRDGNSEELTNESQSLFFSLSLSLFYLFIFFYIVSYQ